MHLRARFFPLFLVLPGIWLWVTGCVKPTPVPLPPEEIVKRSAGRMKGLSGFHFVIDRSGAPAFLDKEAVGTLGVESLNEATKVIAPIKAIVVANSPIRGDIARSTILIFIPTGK